jgi:hypothetical protein
LREAFSAAKVAFSAEQLPPIGVSFSIATIPNARRSGAKRSAKGEEVAQFISFCARPFKFKQNIAFFIRYH